MRPSCCVDAAAEPLFCAVVVEDGATASRHSVHREASACSGDDWQGTHHYQPATVPRHEALSACHCASPQVRDLPCATSVPLSCAQQPAARSLCFPLLRRHCAPPPPLKHRPRRRSVYNPAQHEKLPLTRQRAQRHRPGATRTCSTCSPPWSGRRLSGSTAPSTWRCAAQAQTRFASRPGRVVAKRLQFCVRSRSARLRALRRFWSWRRVRRSAWQRL